MAPGPYFHNCKQWLSRPCPRTPPWFCRKRIRCCAPLLVPAFFPIRHLPGQLKYLLFYFCLPPLVLPQVFAHFSRCLDIHDTIVLEGDHGVIEFRKASVARENEGIFGK